MLIQMMFWLLNKVDDKFINFYAELAIQNIQYLKNIRVMFGEFVDYFQNLS